MASLNKIMIIGNLGRDPESKMAGTTKVAEAVVAVTERYKDRNGEPQEKTEWINLVFWGKLAEIVEKYLKKGSQIYVEGKLQTRSWENKEGQKQYKTEVFVSALQMLGGKPNGNNSSSHNSDSNERQERDAYEQQVIDDDLPF